MSIIKQIASVLEWKYEIDIEGFKEISLGVKDVCLITKDLSKKYQNCIQKNIYNQFTKSTLLEIKNKAIEFYVNRRKKEKDNFNFIKNDISNYRSLLNEYLDIRIGNNIYNILYVIEVLVKLELNKIKIYKTSEGSPLISLINYDSVDLYLCVAGKNNLDNDGMIIKWNDKDLSKHYRLKLIKSKGLI